MILSFPFPKASSSPDASDRGALPLNGAPVAPVSVSSRDEARTTVRVRYFSEELAVVRYRQGRAGILQLVWRLARGLFRSLHHLRQEPRSVSRISFSPSLSCVALAHGNHHEQERLECLTNLLKEPTK